MLRQLKFASALILVLGLPALAGDASKDPEPAPAADAQTQPADGSGKSSEGSVLASPADAEMTAEEKAERDSRKACKIEICSAFRNKKAEGADVSCPVVKSWRKDGLSKLVGKLKISWPYGGVHCSTTVKLKRAELVKSMGGEKFDSKLEKHEVACSVDREKEQPTQIKFDFSPTVTFENGKATKAKLNWGKIEAPSLIKGALWTATAADNTVNILSSALVEDINDFITKKCDEVKADWEGK